ncbi:MAG: hypothetical protein AB1403_17450, partial [Candidatus Riflebacteria bacterium]
MNETRLMLEACVAACILIESGQNILGLDLPLESFSLPSAKAVVGSARSSLPIDPVLVKNWAAKNGIVLSIGDITGLLDHVPTSRNFSHYLMQLKTCIYKDEIEILRKEVRARAENEDLL